MAYFNGKKILFGPKLVVREGYDIGYADGSAERTAVMGSILDRSIVELTANDLNVRKIGDYAFCNCTKLVSVTIPDVVQEIGDYAFSGCSKLTNLVIPDSVGMIGSNALEIGTETDNAIITMLGEKPPSIQADTFNPSFLSVVIVPYYSLEDYEVDWGTVWEECDKVLVGALRAEDFQGVTSIANNAYKDVWVLWSVEIPEGVSIIGDYAFMKCQGLRYATIPESVSGSNLGKYAFCDCENLEEVVLPSKITKIRGLCFCNCKALKKITIPEGVIGIYGHAFYGCESLRELTVPESVILIEENALGIGTPENKATIIMKAKTPPHISTTNIFRTDCVEKIVVPTGCGAVYRSATNWSLIADEIEIEERVM